MGKSEVKLEEIIQAFEEAAEATASSIGTNAAAVAASIAHGITESAMNNTEAKVDDVAVAVYNALLWVAKGAIEGPELDDKNVISVVQALVQLFGAFCGLQVVFLRTAYAMIIASERDTNKVLAYNKTLNDRTEAMVLSVLRNILPRSGPSETVN